jgi:predicted transcriptional regulator of viral defense system
VFTTAEFDEYQEEKNSWTKKSTLAYYCKQGRLLSIRRGLYGVVPTGVKPDRYSVDPYLLTSRMSNDAVLAFHTALEVFGKAYSTFERYIFLSDKRIRPARFRNLQFERAIFPPILTRKGQQNFATTTVERSGLDIRVTSLERTMVDLLDCPRLGGGWEEIYRSLESVEYFDLDVVIEYVYLLEKKTTAAKVGYYLEQHASELMVEKAHLEKFRKLIPRQPHYFDRRVTGVLVKDWNVIVPKEISERSWEAVI